jgi:hypothetical protein
MQFYDPVNGVCKRWDGCTFSLLGQRVSTSARDPFVLVGGFSCLG